MRKFDECSIQRTDRAVKRVCKEDPCILHKLLHFFLSICCTVIRCEKTFVSFQRTDDADWFVVLFFEGCCQGSHGHGFSDQSYLWSSCQTVLEICHGQIVLVCFFCFIMM